MRQGRFDRNIRVFGSQGQERLRGAKVAVVGVGGLGTHVVQQLAHLGVGALALIDHEELATSNLNRYVGARHDDPIPGMPKTDLAERLVRAIDPTIATQKIPHPLRTTSAFAVVAGADCVFGCVDNEGSRLVLTELCAAYARPLFDLASEILPGDPPSFGGRVAACIAGKGCLVCMDLLDLDEAASDLESPELRRDREAIYGVHREGLDEAGPSVVSVNGVVASLAVSEFLVWITGLREPERCLTYLGHLGIVTKNADPPLGDCYYCHGIWGKPDQADLDRYRMDAS
jgi:molybdopterin/thiamine biosynthesis adenylyltransferase